MRLLNGREDSLTENAKFLETPTEEVSRPYRHHLEQRAEKSESVGSAVRPESVVRPAKAVKLWPRTIR